MNTAIILNRVLRLLYRKFMKIPIGLLTFFAEKVHSFPRFCPCCNRSVPFWLDYDSSYKNVVCPFCESHPRHRSLSVYLQRFYKNQLGSKKILHIAPEKSIAKTLRDRRANMVVTLDKNKLGVDIKANLEQLPFASGVFDLVICSHVLEHVENDIRAMQEIARVLDRNGWAFVGVPLDWNRDTTYEDWNITQPSDRLKAFGREDHLRVYGRDYGERLKGGNMELKSISPLEFVSKEEMDSFGLENEKLLFARAISITH